MFGVRPRQADVRAGIVLNETGTADLHVEKTRWGTKRHRVKIGTRDLTADADVYAAIDAGQRYQVFYTSVSKMILGIIRLDESGAEVIPAFYAKSS